MSLENRHHCSEIAHDLPDHFVVDRPGIKEYLDNVLLHLKRVVHYLDDGEDQLFVCWRDSKKGVGEVVILLGYDTRKYVVALDVSLGDAEHVAVAHVADDRVNHVFCLRVPLLFLLFRILRWQLNLYERVLLLLIARYY